MQKGILARFKTPTSRSPSVPNSRALRGRGRPKGARTKWAPGLPQDYAQRKSAQDAPLPLSSRPGARPTFHGDGGDAPPAGELRAAKEVRAEQRVSARPWQPPRVGRLRSSPPFPLRALCRWAAARAAHPGREAPLPPAPLPLARPPGRASRRAHAPLAPSRARPARRSASAPAPPQLAGSLFLALDQKRGDVGGKRLPGWSALTLGVGRTCCGWACF